MAAPAVETIIIDQSNRNESCTHFKLPLHSKIIVHTGNIATWNSLRSRKTQIPANELYHCLQRTIDNWIGNESKKENSNIYQGIEAFESEEERSLIKITAKILLHKFEVSFLEEAVKTALQTLKLKYFDTVILSLPPIDDEGRPFVEVVEPYWQEMEKFHSSGMATKLSSCDLDKENLKSLVDIAKVKPEINQVNLSSCCHMPQDLVDYAKSEDIVLQTHGDQHVMLPDSSLKELFEEHHPTEGIDFRTNWLVRYVGLIKCRGVIKTKGYIAAIESRSAS